MSVSLTQLRRQTERERFERLRVDDSRTAIDDSAARELAAQLKKRIDGEVRFRGRVDEILLRRMIEAAPPN